MLCYSAALRFSSWHVVVLIAARIDRKLASATQPSCRPAPVSSGVRPNILFIVADDLGYNDVSFHSKDGHSQIQTPSLDALAASGVDLRNYYVQPVCSPTRACFMSGRHVIHTGCYSADGRVWNTFGLRPEFAILPQKLKCLGYATHAVGKWHLGSHRPDLVPTGRGFDTFYGYYGAQVDYYTHKTGGWRDFHFDIHEKLSPRWLDEGIYSTHLFSLRAEAIIAEFARSRHESEGAPQSLFLYLAYQAIHSPDEVPREYSNRFSDIFPEDCGSCRKAVCGMVSALDEGIGNVTAALKRAGLWEQTVIIFSTDNGGPAQGFNENHASNWPLRGMKRTLWEGGVRGVGLISGAGLKKIGYVSEQMYHAVDWMPSLLSLAVNGLDRDPASDSWISWTVMTGHNEPEWQLGDGIDVWRSLATGSASPRTEIVHEAHSTSDDGIGQAIRIGDFKLIVAKGPEWHGPPNDLWYESGSDPSNYSHVIDCGGPAPRETEADYCHPDKLPCLFNIKEDPCEFHDLSSKMPNKVKVMIERLRDYQITAVPTTFHELPSCSVSANPKFHPDFNGTWMPYCPSPWATLSKASFEFVGYAQGCAVYA